jgi:hypothetical protein
VVEDFPQSAPQSAREEEVGVLVDVVIGKDPIQINGLSALPQLKVLRLSSSWIGESDEICYTHQFFVWLIRTGLFTCRVVQVWFGSTVC